MDQSMAAVICLLSCGALSDLFLSQVSWPNSCVGGSSLANGKKIGCTSICPGQLWFNIFNMRFSLSVRWCVFRSNFIRGRGFLCLSVACEALKMWRLSFHCRASKSFAVDWETISCSSVYLFLYCG